MILSNFVFLLFSFENLINFQFFCENTNEIDYDYISNNEILSRDTRNFPRNLTCSNSSLEGWNIEMH